MLKYFIYIFLFVNFLYGQNIDALLKEYELKTEESLSTVDEKLGHVTVYSQKDLKLMQYTTLSDLLKEFYSSNLNKNRFGIYNFSLPGTQTNVSGFFRFFINDHEITTNYAKSISSSWMELPIDLVEYIEVYRGNSSFALGNQNGIFFVRIYTKKPVKENGTQVNNTVGSHGSNSQSLSHAESFENGWSYLAYLNKTKIKEEILNGNDKYSNHSDNRYLYLNIQKESTDINIGYTDLKKSNYFGISLDSDPDDGEVYSKDYFIDFKRTFLDDNSLTMQISYDRNDLEYEEENSSGLGLIPFLDLTNLANTIPKSYYKDSSLETFKTFLSQSFSYKKNNILFGINLQESKLKTKKISIVNFADKTFELNKFSEFDKEQSSSFLIQDDYQLSDNLLLVGNLKFDKVKRNAQLDDFTDHQYRIGGIYTPFENFGLKAFYTKTYITPSFYNIDYASSVNKNLKRQNYKYYALEGVYAKGNSKFSVIYNNVKIDDFIYYSPVGFINVEQQIKTDGLTFNYTYEFMDKSKLQLNYFTTNLSERVNNSNKGGYIKYMGEYESLEYFASLIYRNNYKHLDVTVPKSYNFNMGVSYNVSPDYSISLKVENLFDKSTQSLFQEGLTQTSFPIKDYQREVTLSMKWVF